MKFTTLFLLISFISVCLYGQEEPRIQVAKLADFKVKHIYVSPSNEVIVSTPTGIYKFNSLKSSPVKLSDANTIATLQDRKGQIIALETNGIHNLTTAEKIDLPGETLFSDFVYHKGSYWVSSNKGLLKINRQSGEKRKQYTVKNSKLESNQLNFIFVDNQKKMWVGTDKGIVIIDDDKRWKVYEKRYSMHAMTYNKEGLWLVSDAEMWLIDPYGRWYPTGVERGLKKGVVKDVTTDKDGRLVLASEEIIRYDPYKEAIYSYTDSLGFQATNTTAIQGDMNQNIWYGTHDGLYVISFSDTKITPLFANIENTKPLTCKNTVGATLESRVMGGKPPYKYNWNDGLSRSKKLVNKPVGEYTLVVTDAASNTFEVTYKLESKYPMNLEINTLKKAYSIETKDGEAQVLVTGGEMPYTYAWSNGESDALAKTLPAGQLSVTVTDKNKCTARQVFVLGKDKHLPQLEVNNISIGKTLQINDLNFIADSTFIQPTSYAVLDEIYDFMKTNTNVHIEIGGHTNNIPSKAYCYKLSSARAKNVAEYLTDKGILKERIVYKGYGKDNPIADNNTASGRAKNQRVEIKILKIE